MPSAAGDVNRALSPTLLAVLATRVVPTELTMRGHRRVPL